MRHELGALSKGGMRTKLKVMKDLCLIRLHSANSTAHIYLKAGDRSCLVHEMKEQSAQSFRERCSFWLLH